MVPVRRKILVLSCCAPCSCGALKTLVNEGMDVSVLFYNPNIYPQEEHDKRLSEQRRLCEALGVHCIDLAYEPQVWDKAVAGLENEPERGKRCSVCFYMRLLRGAAYAREHKFDVFASVLGVSRYKDLDQVNTAARQVWIETGKPYWARNWRRGGMEELRRALVKELELYQQDYCGCKYSLAARLQQKQPKEN